MTASEFQHLLAEDVSGYKSFLETDSKDWIVKGIIDARQNIYTISNDTKLVSKIIEILLIPKLYVFGLYNNLEMLTPSKQNFYPDLTFRDADGNLFALDFKSSYYKDNLRVNGLTLGSYWGYFRNRNSKMNVDFPYGDYKCHLVLGVLYKQSEPGQSEKNIYSLDELQSIRSVIKNFVFFLQPKWRIASDHPGSGNTRNIGGIDRIEDLVAGNGPFTAFGKDGEKIFDDYWMNYFGRKDAKDAGMDEPKYVDLKTYREYLQQQSETLSIIEK